MPPGFEFKAFVGADLDVPDGYEGLSAKTQAICRYACAFDYDWLIIADDDVYVRTERLAPPPAPYEYAGHILPRELEPHTFPYCAGAFYWLSRNAFKLIADARLPTKVPQAEDQWVAQVLSAHGIFPLELEDVCLQECGCGFCTPKRVGDNWTALSLWYKWDAETFRELERLYAPAT
jgi:hypothetical protein